MNQFEKFSASELYCPKCRCCQPVYERLLLVLPNAEIYDIRCQQCATSLGQREARAPSLATQMTLNKAAATQKTPSRRRLRA